MKRLNSNSIEQVQDVRSDVDKVLVGMKRARGEGERRRLRNELKDLRKELRERERKAMRDILQVTKFFCQPIQQILLLIWKKAI